MSKRRGAVPSGVTLRKDTPATAWVEVAPGLFFGVRSLPTRWVRFWHRVLLGWTYTVIRP